MSHCSHQRSLATELTTFHLENKTQVINGLNSSYSMQFSFTRNFASSIWNILLENVVSASTLQSFQHQVKTSVPALIPGQCRPTLVNTP